MIADTTIDLLAARGSRGLTHRAVDAAAGLPDGSTSYYFRSRGALLIAAAERLAQLDLAPGDQPNPAVAAERATGVHDLCDLFARLVHEQATTYRRRTLARYELSLEAARNPEVAAVMTAIGSSFTGIAARMLENLGARDPVGDARALIAACAGLVFESTLGAQQSYTQHEIRAVICDLLTARTQTPGTHPPVHREVTEPAVTARSER
jgi:AcrR family transcriptional regulator